MSRNGGSRAGDVTWFCLQEVHLLPPSSALLMEAACSSETLVHTVYSRLSGSRWGGGARII